MSELLPEELATKSAYDTLGSQWATQHSSTGFWQEEMGKFHELLPAGKIIEIGSGGGRDALELVELGYKYVGTDVSSGLLEVARNELPNQSFYEQSVYDLDLGGELFDGFWASAVLLHIPKARIKEALDRIKTVITDRAIGFISLKDGTGERMETEEIDGQKIERFFSYWPKDDFTNILSDTGYEVVNYDYRPMSEKTKWHTFIVMNHIDKESA